MANTTEEELAHIDMRERGELKLTNKRLYGRVRLQATPEEVKHGGAGIIRTTKGVFRERDFDAPVSTIEKLAAGPSKAWVSFAIVTVIAPIVVGFIVSAVVAIIAFLGCAAVTAFMYLMSKKTIVFSFVGNGEPLRFPLPIARKADVEDFISKVTAATQKALN